MTRISSGQVNHTSVSKCSNKLFVVGIFAVSDVENDLFRPESLGGFAS
jgi:hypothetical protein